jgi:hypothetical protein
MSAKRLLGVLLIGCLTASASAHADTPTTVTTTFHFHSLYDRLIVSYHLGQDSRCVADAYGVYADLNCTRIDRQSADWDLRVYTTTSKLVYERSSVGFQGHGSVFLFWWRLGAPFCGPSKHFVRNYRAVVRVFSPLDNRVLAERETRFGLRCK